jgi:Holliday junction resolvase RusA-like endonuclease
MSVSHTFFLPIKPFAAERTRCACRGKYPTVYSAPKYREWKDQAIALLREIAATEDFRDVADRPVEVNLTAVVEKPKTSKRDYPRGDRDNHEKGVFDAITQSGKWWTDDDQIVGGSFSKRWARPGEREGYLVEITFL